MIYKKADDFVTLTKKMQMELSQLELVPELDFMGCGHYYVLEKLNSLEETVKFYKRAIRTIHKEQKESSGSRS